MPYKKKRIAAAVAARARTRAANAEKSQAATADTDDAIMDDAIPELPTPVRGSSPAAVNSSLNSVEKTTENLVIKPEITDAVVIAPSEIVVQDPSPSAGNQTAVPACQDPFGTLLSTPALPAKRRGFSVRMPAKKRSKEPQSSEQETEITETVEKVTEKPEKPPKKLWKKPKRGPGRPKNPALIHDVKTGAVHNYSRATAVGRAVGKNRRKVDIAESSTMAWLSFWTDEQKRQLLDAAVAHGTDCDPTLLKAMVPSRSLRDVKLFIELLRKTGKKVMKSREFSLGCGMSAVEAASCREPFSRIPVGPDVTVTGTAHDALKEAFLYAVGTSESGDLPEPNTVDFDRIYRLLALCLQPDASAGTLRSIISEADLSVVRVLLDRMRDLAIDSVHRQDDLVAVLRSRLRIEAEMLPFTTDIPTGPYGEVARNLACLPDLNPLRLGPNDLIFSNQRKESQNGHSQGI